MRFCEDCGSAMVQVDEEWRCRSCNPESIPDGDSPSPKTPQQGDGSVTQLPTTDSGSVRKADAMRWLESLDEPSPHELKKAIKPKPSGFTGSTYPTSISNIRVTGDPEFIETVAGLFKPVLDFEDSGTRVELNLQETEDRDSDEFTGNYALYLSVAERG